MYHCRPSQQHVKNVGLLLQCEELDNLRLLFCKHKLKVLEVSDLRTILDDIIFVWNNFGGFGYTWLVNKWVIACEINTKN